jgi:hypothetical protein
MGFKYESNKKKNKNAPRKASGVGMILIFICIAAAVVIGWWAPLNIPFRAYLPIPDNWYAPLIRGVEILPIQLVAGLAAFILLQFVVVLLGGIISPPQPEDLYDEKTGLYMGKRKR